MTISEWAVSVSAIGTFPSAATAVLTYIVSTLQKSRQVTQQAAEEIREQVRKVREEIAIAETILRDGTALIAGADAVSEAIFSKLPQPASPDDIPVEVRQVHEMFRT